MYGDHGPARKAQRKKKNTEMFRKNLKNLGKLSTGGHLPVFFSPFKDLVYAVCFCLHWKLIYFKDLNYWTQGSGFTLDVILIPIRFVRTALGSYAFLFMLGWIWNLLFQSLNHDETFLLVSWNWIATFFLFISTCDYMSETRASRTLEGRLL
jgi:hypothetical protein